MRGDSAHHAAEFPATQAPLRILDLGTGSGCILAALLSELPQARGIGLDRSEAALAVARDNLSRLGLRDRASFLCANWMSAIGGGAFDVIVCNPPYIAPSEIRQLGLEVRAYDPYLALDGGEDGLEAYRIIIPQAFAALSAGGLLVFEVGHRQAGAVLRFDETFCPLSRFFRSADLAGFSGNGSSRCSGATVVGGEFRSQKKNWKFRSFGIRFSEKRFRKRLWRARENARPRRVSLPEIVEPGECSFGVHQQDYDGFAGGIALIICF